MNINHSNPIKYQLYVDMITNNIIKQNDTPFWFNTLRK